MKDFKLARQSQVVTVLSPVDAARMLASGDYVLAKPKPGNKGRDADRMRSIRNRRVAEGWRNVDMWLSPDDQALVDSVRLPKESFVDLLRRLVTERHSHVNDFGVGDTE